MSVKKRNTKTKNDSHSLIKKYTMNNRTLEEIQASEGGRAAKKIIIRIKIAIIILIIFMSNTSRFFVHNFGDEAFGYEILNLLVAFTFLIGAKIHFLSVHNILIKECNPYKAEEAYIYIINKSLYRYKLLSQQQLYLFIAGSITYQRDYDRAGLILSNINHDTLRMREWFLYYNCIRKYYTLKGDEEALENIKKVLTDTLSNEKLQKYHKAIRVELEMINLRKTMQAGDLSVYEQLQKRKDWTRDNSRLVSVDHSYVDAKAYKIKGDIEAAKARCHYVILNGNQTHYVDLAQAMLNEFETSPPHSPDK